MRSWGIAAIIITAGAVACGGQSPSTATRPPEVAMRDLAPTLHLVEQAARAALVPWRCTALRAGQAEVVPLRRGQATLRIAVLGELHDATPASLDAAKLFLATAAQAPLDAVVLLGGNAATSPALERLLKVVASPAYLTVIVPGDRERVPEVRDVIASHPERRTLVDATRPTVLDAGWARFVVVGGMPAQHQLAWPVDGCVYNTTDVAALVGLAKALPSEAASPHVPFPWTIALATAPVRGSADLGSTQLHVGDPALAVALSDVDAVIFAGAEVASEGGQARPRQRQPVQIALGSLAAEPAYNSQKQPIEPSALILTVTPNELVWRRWSAGRRLLEAP